MGDTGSDSSQTCHVETGGGEGGECARTVGDTWRSGVRPLGELIGKKSPRPGDAWRGVQPPGRAEVA